MEVFRCITCGNLLNMKMVRKGICAGHYVRDAVHGTFFEWLKVRVWEITDRIENLLK